jgi:transcriptional regulator with PAS, ATPase and Fis domain
MIRELLADPIPVASARAAAFNVAERLPPGFDAWFSRCVCRDAEGRFRDASECFPPLLALWQNDRVTQRPHRRQGGPPPAGEVVLPPIVGSSPKMQRIFSLIARIAPTDSSVLITGESGTGKELIARAIHLQSRRANEAFLAINCGALPENLLESELFGHTRGSFTGAWTDKKGLFEEAHLGTLFLDEVGEMPPASQVKLLRVLQDHEIRRVGSNQPLKVDVRILAATNRDLRQAMERGSFREDLYYRLNVFQIDLPPLRERGDDIALMAHYFLERYARQMNKPIRGFETRALYHVLHYGYPGNVRELENVIQRAVALADHDEIRTEDLPVLMREGSLPLLDAPRDEHPLPDDLTLEQLERLYIQKMLSRNGGNVTVTARKLGISRSTLWRKMKQYEIPGVTFPTKN